MAWRGDLVARLRADATLAGLCSTRIAFFEAARSWEENYPQLVLTEISVQRDYTHSGGADGLDQVRVQFDIWAKGDDPAYAVEAALEAVMEAGGTQDDTIFHPAFLQDRDLSSEDLGNGRRVQRLRMDFQFFHEAV